MTWPFIGRADAARLTLALVRAEVAEAQVAELRTRLVEADRFRVYYERLADELAMRAGATSGPVHVPVEERGDPTINRVLKVAGLVGNFHGAPLTGPRHGTGS